MKVYDAPSIRNVAIVGHGGCGKTSLVSALLFDAGAVNRLGRVDDGTTVTDFDPDEIERKISLLAAPAFAEWKKAKVNVLDAPGYANFLSEARSALRVADAAIVVVDAVAGVEVQTEKVWGYAEEYGLPAIDRGQPDGPGERLVRAGPGEGPGGVRTRRAADRGPGGRGEGLQGASWTSSPGRPRCTATTRAASSRSRTCPPPSRTWRSPGARSSSRWWRRATRSSWRSSSRRARCPRSSSRRGCARRWWREGSSPSCPSPPS